MIPRSMYVRLNIIELTVWLAVWKPTPRMADVTKIAGYVRILVNR